jgi:sugar lactone lactonase YvrE
MLKASAFLPFLCVLTAALSADAHHPAIGDGFELAPVPSPGYPEGIVVDQHRVYVATPASYVTAGHGPSAVFEYDERDGTLLDTIYAVGENLAEPHAFSCLTTDRDHRLYVISTQLGIARYTHRDGGWVQDIYADPLPQLPACNAVPPGTPCAPIPAALPPFPNDLAFDAAGNLYITDSYQATIFRVPPGGGVPEIWFQSTALAGLPGLLGTNGIRVTPDGHGLVFDVSFSLELTPPSPPGPPHGAMYRLPLVDQPTEADLVLLHEYLFAEVPDGVAFGESGTLYVDLPGSNQIGLLAPDGTETGRLSGPTGSTIPYDNPANIAFDDQTRSILVANHAIESNNVHDMAVLEVFVDDRAAPLFKPDFD